MATSKCGAHLPSLLVKQILFDFFLASCKKKKRGMQNQSKLEYKNVADIFLKWFPFIGDAVAHWLMSWTLGWEVQV